MCGAAGSRERWRRRQEMRCEGYCEAMLSSRLTALSPAPGSGQTHEAHSLPLPMAKPGLLGSDQPLKDLNLISKAALNVLQAGGRREIIAVEEKRPHVCHEHFGFG